MLMPILLPDLGVPATLSLWYAEPGEAVLAGERLVEILADGATFEVISPASGTLLAKCVFPREDVSPGQVLGLVEET